MPPFMRAHDAVVSNLVKWTVSYVHNNMLDFLIEIGLIDGYFYISPGNPSRC